MMELDSRCKYDPKPLGELESIVLFYHDKDKLVIPFHITKTAYVKLNAGCGRCYGRTPWAPWCWLKVYDYRVVSYYKERNQEKIKEIEDELYS